LAHEGERDSNDRKRVPPSGDAIPARVARRVFLRAHPSRRFRSAWMGICIHSIEAVFFLVVLFPLVFN
jgi:hypothetical protein